jgi:hypothetical protein
VVHELNPQFQVGELAASEPRPAVDGRGMSVIANHSEELVEAPGVNRDHLEIDREGGDSKKGRKR